MGYHLQKTRIDEDRMDALFIQRIVCPSAWIIDNI